MSFVVNGADWDFHGLSPAEVEELIDHALAFVETSRERGEAVSIGDDFQTRRMHGEATLWDLFSVDSPLPLPRELSQELTAWLMRAPRYADSELWPAGFEDAMISIGGAPSVINEDIAWVHYSLRSGVPSASLTLRASDVVVTSTASGNVETHFVSNEPGRARFWRDMIVRDGDSLESLAQFSSRAYPDLHFVDGVLTSADHHLAGGYLASRQRVQRALEILNDWGFWVFMSPPPALAPGEARPLDPDARPSNHIIELRFAGLGITAAPENPDVRGHRESRQARETLLLGRTLYCEWHVKLQPHQNRIHFHKPVAESCNKVVIGMIHEHLPLP
ncbi:hypothetical protein NDN16_17280 [Aureimonas altamirensis]|uniref:hypothetical protein n=1 Tax=Aureimonas altamirensis TaxID=370622 RepID=UPI002036C75F|nr:hypothetical protein [Aureimonas altamirensis]MCM2505423.1 hypothetical protein [Aureimonas altamirensis]